jgi:hypothetical protein
MIWPGSNCRYYSKPQYLFEACSDFKYDYDNLLYIVAGEVIHVVSGKAGVILLKSVLWHHSK